MPKRDRTLTDTQDPMWKVRDLVANLGGIGPLTEKLIAKGFAPPPPNTIQGWVSRNSIPGTWSPAVFALAIEEGLIRTPLDAMIKDLRL